MLSKFLDPKNDYAFRRIFGSERHKDILIHFLNDIFGRTSNPIEEVIFLKTVQEPELASKRESAVDVLCRDASGERFIVEMQVESEPGFEKRAQYYAARTYIDQRERQKQEEGKEIPAIDYKDLKEVTFLGITNFILFKDKPGWLCHHVMLDTKTGERNLKDFSFSFLELPKFKKKKDQLKTLTEKWTYFFKHAKQTTAEDLPIIIGDDVIIRRAYEALDRFSWSSEELLTYEGYEMKEASNRAVIEGARDQGLREGLEKGKAEGLSEGIEKGKAEGLVEGLEKGEAKGLEKVARQMQSMGMDLATIEKVTGILKKDLERLPK